MASKPETVFRKIVRRDLTKLSLLGPLFFEAIQQKAISGTPDYLLCVRGGFIALELKAPTGKVSRLQDEKLNAIARAEGLGFVVRPSNWKPIYEFLKRITLGESHDDSADPKS